MVLAKICCLLLRGHPVNFPDESLIDLRAKSACKIPSSCTTLLSHIYQQPSYKRVINVDRDQINSADIQLMKTKSHFSSHITWSIIIMVFDVAAPIYLQK
jgi:hypothetical protein